MLSTQQKRFQGSSTHYNISSYMFEQNLLPHKSRLPTLVNKNVIAANSVIDTNQMFRFKIVLN